jgi:hypothetical protein
VTQPLSDTTVKPRLGLYLALLFAACILLGLYCCELNRQFYAHHHPVYDSLSYNEKLFRVMTISRESGFFDSLETACFSNNTNCLPFIVAASVAKVIEPSRSVGVWIQTGILFLFLASLLSHLVRVRDLKPTTAIAGCFCFFIAKCIFFPNGGLSDFRMDLSLYLAFAMTCVWFLQSMSRPTKLNFFLLGVSASIACLFRATAPIYLLFTLGPLALIELTRSENRAAKFAGIVISFVTVLVLAGWFFFLNFEFLRFYYVEWNTDANAKIPFVEALDHIDFVQRSIGLPLIVLLASWMIATGLDRIRKGSFLTSFGQSIRSGDLDWRIFWIGISPVLMMILRRAGLNPFVSMPAVFGLILFFALPCLRHIDQSNSVSFKRFCWTMLVVCLIISCFRGWKRHQPKGFDTMSMQQHLIDSILTDAKSRGVSQLKFGVMQLTDLNSNSLYSTLLFDRTDATPTLNGIQFDQVEFKRVATFSRPAATDWKNVDGQTDEEKFDYLIADANARIDYLILPDSSTAQALKTTAAHNYINRYLVPLRERIVNDESWSRVGEAIAANESEVVEIYRKSR